MSAEPRFRQGNQVRTLPSVSPVVTEGTLETYAGFIHLVCAGADHTWEVRFINTEGNFQCMCFSECELELLEIPESEEG